MLPISMPLSGKVGNLTTSKDVLILEDTLELKKNKVPKKIV